MVKLARRASARLYPLTRRLVPGAGADGAPAAPHREDPAPGPPERPSGGDPADGPPTSPPVLIAGRDSERRAMLLKELAEIMPGSTVFEEAGAFSEVLEHAPGSRMVVFSGDLPDVPAESFTRVLARRHPRLPVVRLDDPAPGGDLVAHA